MKAWCDATKGHGQLDNYAVARKNNITLRLDELNSGVSTLLQTASTTSQSNLFATPPQYRFSIYSIDRLWSIGLNSLMALTPSYRTGWSSASSNFGVMQMYSTTTIAPLRKLLLHHHAGGDVATNYDDARQAQPGELYPRPRKRNQSARRHPAKSVFIVTDGVEDEHSGSRRLEQTMNNLAGRPNAPDGNSSGTNWCTTIGIAASRSRSSTPTISR